jgi:1-acyl-sn-glycerol-3-phosphate acyltransferase
MGLFKSGAGLMAVELGVSVVPVSISGTCQILPKGQDIPRHGQVQVRIGEALNFQPGTEYIEATRTLERSVNLLCD